ncbi:MAG: aminopeptidase P family protein [Nanoarchaeota archaeon]|nr:aminopeptidase P family protein [Nanoarchaeota archaeon]
MRQINLEKIDLLLLFSLDEKPDTNLIYLTGYKGIGILAVMKKKSVLVVPEMEYEKAKKTPGVMVVAAEKKRRMLETLCTLLKTYKVLHIGIDESRVSVSLFRRLKKSIPGRYVDFSRSLGMTRMKKDEDEYFCIKKACNVTDLIFADICNNFNFKEENDIRKYIEQEAAKRDCDLAFPPIVASDKASSQPHYAGSSKIKKGFLLLDFGTRYKGYCADMTRMLYLGTPSEKELSDYALVNHVVDECEKASLTKKRYSELYALSLQILGKKAKYFTHGLGHGLGLDIHEAPSLVEEDKNSIEEDIPFTIEPGIYFPNRYGIRIEDTVIIKKGHLEVLTRSSKKLKIIDNK